MMSQEACKWYEKFNNLYSFGINLYISLLLKCKEYHGLCAQKWSGKITVITNLENIAELVQPK